MPRTRSTPLSEPAPEAPAQTAPGASGYPPPGEVLRRLRSQRKLTLRQVADASGLSASFLASLERGETDVALERLARIAQVFDHDIGSFLGYTTRRAQPYILGPDEVVPIDRGPGIDYKALRVPHVDFELFVINLPPHSGFSDEQTHEGLDVTVVTQGRVIATYNHVDYALSQGQCVTWPAGYPHGFRNDSDEPAQYVGVTTARLY